MGVQRAHLRRATLDETARTKLLHQIADGKPLAHILFVEHFPTGIDRDGPPLHDSRGEGDIRRDDDILRGNFIGDVVIRRVETL